MLADRADCPAGGILKGGKAQADLKILRLRSTVLPQTFIISCVKASRQARSDMIILRRNAV